MTLAGALSGIDFTDLDNFANGFPHELFAVHRREAPVYWHDPTDNTPDGEGFWSVATHAETLEVLRDPVTFSSVTGGSRAFGGTLLQDPQQRPVVRKTKYRSRRWRWPVALAMLIRLRPTG